MLLFITRLAKVILLMRKVFRAINAIAYLIEWIPSAVKDGKVTFQEVEVLLSNIGRILKINELQDLSITVPTNGAPLYTGNTTEEMAKYAVKERIQSQVSKLKHTEDDT